MSHLDARVLFDVILTWLGGLGIGIYLLYVLRHRTRSTLETATLFFLGCMMLILITRGFFWSTRSDWIGGLLMLPASLLPLLLLMFGEGLARRHAPLAAKLLALGGALVFIGLDLDGALMASRTLLIGLLAFQLLVLVFTAGFCLHAARAGLTFQEQRLINANLVAAIFAIPLLVTDFREELTWVPQRLGALGALIYIYTSVRMTGQRDSIVSVMLEIGRVFLFSVLVAGCYLLILQDTSRWEAFRCLFLTFGMVLLFTIQYRIASMSAEENRLSFLRWLQITNFHDIDGYLRAMRHLTITREHVVLRQAELDGYDLGKLAEYAGRSVQHLSRIRRDLATGSSKDLDAAEQLVDILEKYRMSQIGIVSVSPPLLVLFNHPSVAGSYLDGSRINVILKIARLVAARAGAGQENPDRSSQP